MRNSLLPALLIVVIVALTCIPACQTKTQTVTSPDGTITVTETTELDQAALSAAMAALEQVTTLGLSVADRIAALRSQQEAANASGNTSLATELGNLIATLEPVLDFFDTEEAKAKSEVARCRSVVDNGRGAWYVDPVTNTAKRNIPTP